MITNYKLNVNYHILSNEKIPGNLRKKLLQLRIFDTFVLLLY